MKIFLICLFLIISYFSYSQCDTLKADILKITNGDFFFIIDKSRSPIIIIVTAFNIILNDIESLHAVSVIEKKDKKNVKKVTYFLFTKIFIKATIYYDNENKIIKVSLLDINGIYFNFYQKLFKI